MKEFLKNLLSDERGSISSKRSVGILCVISLLIAFFVKTQINEHLADLISGIAIVALGLTTWDKYTNK